MTDQEYNTCVDLYADRVFRFVLKHLQNKADAQDVVQTTFMKTWSNREKVLFKKAKSFLFTVAYRSMIDAIRKQKNTSYVAEFADSSGEREDKTAELQEVLQKALTTLPEIQQSLVMLRDYEGYTYREIGEITELSETQVKVYIFRARKSLQKVLGKIEHIL